MFIDDVLGITTEHWASMRADLVAYLPNLGIAAALLVAGLAAAWVARAVVRRVVLLVDRLAPRVGLRSSLRRVGLERPAGEILAALLFWLILLLFVSSALDVLGLPVLSIWVQAVAQYLPRVLAGLLIGLAGIVAGVFLRDAASAAAHAAGLTYGTVIGRLLQMTVLVVSALVAIDQIGINIAVVSQFLVVLLASAFLGAAIAFGLGARIIVSNILACHYLRQSIRVGHRVKMGQEEGEVDEITPTSIVLLKDGSRVIVPAKLFVEEVSHVIG